MFKSFWQFIKIQAALVPMVDALIGRQLAIMRVLFDFGLISREEINSLLDISSMDGYRDWAARRGPSEQEVTEQISNLKQPRENVYQEETFKNS